MRLARSPLPGLATLSLAVLPFVHAVTYNWDVTYVNANPDGLFERRVVGINNAFPPPPIEVAYNDTLVINLHNSLDVPTSLHAHGLFQNGTGYMDGPTMVTQCGIPPNSSFTYTIPIQQHGTYWIHSHTLGQYVDGLRAPLIIHPQSETYHYDAEYTVTVTDWYHDEHHVNKAVYLSPANPSGAEPIPQSGLINNNPSNSTLSFTPGKVYRLRVINMSAFSMFYISIDGHDMEIIEVDGVDVALTKVSSFPITAAQRYSVLVRALNTTDHNYILHADMNPDMFDIVPPDLNLNVTATIVYSPNATVLTSSPSAQPIFDDTVLKPVVAMASAPPDVSIALNVSFAVLDDAVNRATFNDRTYVAPKVPTLLSALSLGEYATQPEAYGDVNPLVVGNGQMIELVINNFDPGMHPFHLHGHQFQVIGRSAADSGPYDPRSPFPEQANPLRRDVIQAPSNGHVVIRFRADNPGVWLFHCHIEWHLEAGLVATIIESPLAIQSSLHPPDALFSQCASQGIATTGNAAGNPGLDLSGLTRAALPFSGTFTPKGIGAFAATCISALLGISAVVWYSWKV